MGILNLFGKKKKTVSKLGAKEMKELEDMIQSIAEMQKAMSFPFPDFPEIFGRRLEPRGAFEPVVEAFKINGTEIFRWEK